MVMFTSPPAQQIPNALYHRLIGKDRTEEAWSITQKLHRNKKDPEDAYAHAEYAQMLAQITFERQHNAVGPLAQARLSFSQKSFLKRLGLGFLVQFGNQCTGTEHILPLIPLSQAQ
jgi:hypothetical protein